MSVEDIIIVVFVGTLFLVGVWLWSVPAYRMYKLARLRKLRAQKRLDKSA